MMVKNLVNQHFQSICAETWTQHKWTHKLISQLPFPEFNRDEFILESDISSPSSEDHHFNEDDDIVLSSVALSLHSMERKLHEIIPRGVLDMNEKWMEFKFDAMCRTLRFVENEREYTMDSDNITSFFLNLPHNIVFDTGKDEEMILLFFSSSIHFCFDFLY